MLQIMPSEKRITKATETALKKRTNIDKPTPPLIEPKIFFYCLNTTFYK